MLTKKFVGDENGHVKELHTVQIEPIVDETGRKIYEEIPGTEQVWPAISCSIAVGFEGPEQTLIEQLGLGDGSPLERESGIRQIPTNVDKVFAAGDMRRGQSLVVWAINEGREAAREVDRYLMGSSCRSAMP